MRQYNRCVDSLESMILSTGRFQIYTTQVHIAVIARGVITERTRLFPLHVS